MSTFSVPIINNLKKTLDLISVQNSIVTSNIANVDTPGYKTSGIDFEKEMQSVFPEKNNIQMAKTDSRHFDGASSSSNEPIRPEIIQDQTSSERMDGNNVNVDLEMTKLAENQILYSSVVQSLSKKMSMLKYAIEGR